LSIVGLDQTISKLRESTKAELVAYSCYAIGHCKVVFGYVSYADIADIVAMFEHIVEQIFFVGIEIGPLVTDNLVKIHSLF
jgi:hypothetical protein